MLAALVKLVDDNPTLNNYCRLIKQKKHINLYRWVTAQLLEIDDINEKIYLLLNSSPACEYGNTKHFLNYKKGYGFCGRAEVCKCLQEKCGTTSKPINDLDKKTARTVLTKKTKKERYGDDSYNNRIKAGLTLFDNYGVTNPMHSAEIKRTLNDTVLRKYGTQHVMQNTEIKTKNKNSNILNNGAFHLRAHLSADVITRLDDICWLIAENNSKSPLQIARDLGVSDTVIYKIFDKNNISYKHHFNKSVWQSELVNYIRSISPCTIIENDRSILDGKEIDIVLPEFMLAIECNGVFWHSEVRGNKNKDYHLDKTLCTDNRGYRLIHIFDNEWHSKKDIIKSRISGLLQLNKKVHARKTRVCVLNKQEEANFFDKNHLQGHVNSDICLGLRVDETLVSAMSFSKSRFNTLYEYELLRYCTELFTNVTGGPSRLLSAFKRVYCPSSIISYSHRTFGHATLYKQIGFRFSHSSPPSYHYTRNYTKLENRQKYQKHRLEKILPVFNKDLTEWENMKNNGFDRIWDCGNDVWVWKDK